MAWLLRVSRLYCRDDTTRDTAAFADRLIKPGGGQFTPETVNKIESGHLAITAEICEAYERALDLTEDDLLDSYIYQTRLFGGEPRFASVPAQMTPADLDLLLRIGSGERLSGREWLTAALVYRRRPDLVLTFPRMREPFLNGLMLAAATTFEREQRFVREAIILVGTPMLPLLESSISENAIRFFNTVETLAFMPSRAAHELAARIAAAHDDAAIAQTALETVTRCAVHDHELVRPAVVDLACRLLLSTDEAYTAREEALRLLALPTVTISNRVRRSLLDLHEDIDQLRLRPRGLTQQDLAAVMLQRVGAQLRATSDLSARLPEEVPGLRRPLVEGATGNLRTNRLSVAILFSASPLASSLAHGLGSVLVDVIQDQDYGLQRSLVRLLTKLQTPAADPYFARFAPRANDDNTRLTVAWALGGANGEDDEAALRQLYEASRQPITRRVVATSAARRHFSAIVETATHDRDPLVAFEATLALRDLQAAE